MSEEHQFQMIDGEANLLEPLFEVGDETTNGQGEPARIICVDVHAPTILRVIALITDQHTGFEKAQNYTPNGTSASGVMAYGNPNAHQYEELNLIPLEK